MESPLRLEQLEDRSVPANWGTPWPDAEHLTFSFAPDGTDVGGRPSGLSAHLSTDLPQALWKREVARAFQTWAVHGNINFAPVADDGAAFGEPGPPQSAAGHGDVRVGAVPLSRQELMISSPFDWYSGWSGDVVLNTNFDFSVGGDGAPDLFTAALHEAGHVLGLDHDDDPASALYPTYSGPKEGLSANDVARLQALYRARRPDAHEGLWGNDASGNATPLAYVDHASDYDQVLRADLTHTRDVDFYRVRTPLFAGDFSVVLRTKGVSLLTAKVEVFDAKMRRVAAAKAVDPFSGDLTLRVDNARSWADYYIRVSGAGKGVFDVGAYEIAAGSRAAQAAYPDRTVIMSDGLLNDVPWLATSLIDTTVQLGKYWEYTGRASIDHADDQDYFAISPPLGALNSTMVLTTWGLESGGVLPRIRVYDLLGRELPAQILSNNDGVYTVQLPGAGLLDKYLVRVDADTTRGAAVGNYFLGVDFRDTSIELDTFTAGQLSPTSPARATRLEVPRAQLYHFVLSAEGADGVTAPVRMTIFDKAGTAVFSLQVAPGKVLTSNVLLKPGVYRVCFEFGAGVTGPLNYLLRGTVRSDPIGPQPEDPTEDPEGTPEEESSETVTVSEEESTYWWTEESTEETTEETTDDEWCYPEDPYTDPTSST